MINFLFRKKLPSHAAAAVIHTSLLQPGVIIAIRNKLLKAHTRHHYNKRFYCTTVTVYISSASTKKTIVVAGC